MGRHKGDAGDPPETIQKCLNCTLPDCINCIKNKKPQEDKA